jgi:ankyrin repeat protein
MSLSEVYNGPELKPRHRDKIRKMFEDYDQLLQLKDFLETLEVSIDMNFIKYIEDFSFRGRTPLCVAILNDDAMFVTELINLGFDVNKIIDDYYTPLSLTTNEVIKNILREHGANLEFLPKAVEIGDLNDIYKYAETEDITDELITWYSNDGHEYDHEKVLSVLRYLQPIQKSKLPTELKRRIIDYL